MSLNMWGTIFPIEQNKVRFIIFSILLLCISHLFSRYFHFFSPFSRERYNDGPNPGRCQEHRAGTELTCCAPPKELLNSLHGWTFRLCGFVLFLSGVMITEMLAASSGFFFFFLFFFLFKYIYTGSLPSSDNASDKAWRNGKQTAGIMLASGTLYRMHQQGMLMWNTTLCYVSNTTSSSGKYSSRETLLPFCSFLIECQIFFQLKLMAKTPTDCNRNRTESTYTKD